MKSDTLIRVCGGYFLASSIVGIEADFNIRYDAWEVQVLLKDRKTFCYHQFGGQSGQAGATNARDAAIKEWKQYLEQE